MSTVAAIINEAQNLAGQTQRAASSMIDRAVMAASSFGYTDINLGNVQTGPFNINLQFDSGGGSLIYGSPMLGYGPSLGGGGGGTVVIAPPAATPVGNLLEPIMGHAEDSSVDSIKWKDLNLKSYFPKSGDSALSLLGGAPVELPTMDEADAPDAIPVAFNPGLVGGNETLELMDVWLPELYELPEAPEEIDVTSLFQATQPTSMPVPEFQKPTINDLTVPDAPQLNLPAYQAPSGGPDIEAPEIVLPEYDGSFVPGAFAGDLPDEDALNSIAGEHQARVSGGYQSRMDHEAVLADRFLQDWSPQCKRAMAVLESRVAEYMEAEGEDRTILAAGVENQIFERGRSRVLAERFAGEKELASTLAKRGFVAPPGVLQAAVKEAIGVVARAMATYASETAIQRAQIEIEYQKYMFDFTKDLRFRLIETMFRIKQEAREVLQAAVDHSKVVADFSVQIFNMRAGLFEAKISLYRARAEAFSAQLEASFADLRRYQALIEAEKLKSDMEKNHVDVFRAKLETEELKASIYTQQLAGVQVLAGLEKHKLDLFRTEIEGYAVQVRAKESEFGAYKAAIDGDKAKVEAYGQLANNYKTRVDGVKVQVEAGQILSDSINQANRVLIARFEAGLSQARLKLEAEGRRFDSERDAYLAALELYKADIDKNAEHARQYLSANEQTLKRQIAMAETAISERRNAIETAKATADAVGTEGELQLRANIANVEARQPPRDRALRAAIAAGDLQLKSQDQVLRHSIDSAGVYLQGRDIDVKQQAVFAESAAADRETMRKSMADMNDAIAKQGDLSIRRTGVSADVALKVADLTFQAAKASADNRTRLVEADRKLIQESIDLRARIAMAGAEAYGSMASAAMSAVNGIAQQYVDESGE